MIWKRVLSLFALALALQSLAGARAVAQEVMEFEPVPRESVAATERVRSREAERTTRERRRTRVDIPAAPDAPGVPEPLETGDVVRIGSDIHIDKDQVIDGDVFALRGDIRVDGHVKGNVAATGGDVHLGSTARVDGDVMCIGGQLEEEPGARVGGQRVTALHGTRHRGPRNVRVDADPFDWESHGRASHVSFALSWLLLSLLLAWGIARFAPTRTAVALATLKREPGLSLLFGLGLVFLLVPSVVAMALVVAILCITIIGIPLALGVMLAYAGLLVMLVFWGYVLGVIPVGERLATRLGRDGTNLVRAALFGVLGVAGLRLVAELFHFLPLFGWLANLIWVVAAVGGAVLTLMGAGALVRSKFGQGVGARWWPLFKTGRPAVPAAATEGPPPAPGPTGTPNEPSPAA